MVKTYSGGRAVAVVRDLMAGSAPMGDIGWVLVSCAVVVAVFAPITIRLYGGKSA